MTEVAAPKSDPLTPDLPIAARLREWIEPAGSWLYGFLVVALVAGNTGGYLPTTHGWTAVVTLWLAAIVLLLRDRIEFSMFDLTFVGGLTAFTAWVTLSNVWSPSLTSTMHEVQRDLAYVGIALAGLLLTSRRTVPHLLGGVLAGVTLLCLYALGTRILPDRLGSFDSEAFGYRLATPITYWNGLGVFAVMGTLLALGFAARAQHLATRALAGASLAPLAVAMYFTFSRGAWGALAVGLVAMVVVDPRRIQLMAVGMALAPWPVLAIREAHDRKALVTVGATFAGAVKDGHSFVLPLAIISFVAAVVAVAVGVLERRVAISRGVRVGFVLLVTAAVLSGVAIVWKSQGSPPHLADKAWASFRSPPKRGADDVSARLFQLSSNGRLDLWSVSWESFERNPVVGTGAGTFRQEWAASSRSSFSTIEGHSVVAETIGELGVVGLVLLLSALVAPLAALASARHHGLAVPAGGAYVAWLAHASIDWDWELVGVTSVALLSGVALVRSASARHSRSQMLPAWGSASAAAVLAVLSFAATPALLADHAVREGRSALPSRPAETLAQASNARRWAPWSSEPDEITGDAHRTMGDLSASRTAYAAALASDRSNWTLWTKLADVSVGSDRRDALRRAHALNPDVIVP